ncbi:MAG: SET domain-containing protein-lysine N-methyltransferase [Bacteroidota bacterium]
MYSPTLVFTDSCRKFQSLRIEDLSFYLDDSERYDQLSERYASLVSKSYVAPGVIQWISEEVGYGYFATRYVQKDAMVGEYTGKIMFRSEFKSGAYAWSYPKGGDFQRTLAERISLNASIYGNEMRFVNHSDTPNLRAEQVFHGGQWHMIYVANRGIVKGEELLVSYGQQYWRKREQLEW